MRITDDIGIPIKGIACFHYMDHKVIFDTLNGPDNPHVMVEDSTGKSYKIGTVENAIKLIDRLITAN